MTLHRPCIATTAFTTLPFKEHADIQYGHSSVVNPLGDVIAEADEKEAIVYADIGKPPSTFQR